MPLCSASGLLATCYLTCGCAYVLSDGTAHLVAINRICKHLHSQSVQVLLVRHSQPLSRALCPFATLKQDVVHVDTGKCTEQGTGEAG